MDHHEKAYKNIKYLKCCKAVWTHLKRELEPNDIVMSKEDGPVIFFGNAFRHKNWWHYLETMETNITQSFDWEYIIWTQDQLQQLLYTLFPEATVKLNFLPYEFPEAYVDNVYIGEEEYIELLWLKVIMYLKCGWEDEMWKNISGGSLNES